MYGDKETCTKCGERVEIYGYCENNGQPFCEACWGNHVQHCSECRACTKIEIEVDVVETDIAYSLEVMIGDNPYFIRKVGDMLYGIEHISNRILDSHASDIVDAIEKAIIEYIDMGE